MAAPYIQTERGRIPVLTGSPLLRRERLSEWLWFTLCLVLFLVLGPFSAPIVLCFMFSGELLETGMAEPEPLAE